MKLVAIESPLAGDFERNRRYALWCAYHCRTLGEAAYASHLFYTQFLDDESAEDRAFGMAAGLEWSFYASIRVFYIDLGYSNGMNEAREALGGVVGEDLKERNLPPEMWSAFERGEIPNPTPAFADKRLRAVFELLNAYDDALCERKHGGIAASTFVDGVREALGVGPFERRRKKP